MDFKDKKVLIGMPSYSGLVPTITLQGLLQLIKPCPSAFMAVDRQRIDKARNAIAMEALKQGVDYLFFVDDDNPIPPDTLIKLMEDDKDVVMTPILGRNPDKNGVHPMCAFYAEVHKVDGKDLKLYFPITNFRDEGYLHRIDGGGAGCLLIKRKVLEALYKKYKDYIFEFGDIKFQRSVTINGVLYDRRTMSEDCEFSERVVDAGFEVWLDDRVKPIHITGFKAVQWQGGINGKL